MIGGGGGVDSGDSNLNNGLDQENKEKGLVESMSLIDRFNRSIEYKCPKSDLSNEIRGKISGDTCGKITGVRSFYVGSHLVHPIDEKDRCTLLEAHEFFVITGILVCCTAIG